MRLKVLSSSNRIFLFSVLLFGGTAVIHIYVTSNGPDYASPLLIFERLFHLFAAFTLLSLCTAAGRFAMQQFGIAVDQPIEAILFSVTIGSGIVATLILLLGLFGGLNAPVLGLLFVLIALLSRKEVKELPALTSNAVSFMTQNGGSRVAFGFGLIVLGIASLIMILLATLPPTDWDSLMYHLRVPAEFLQEGKIYLPEDSPHFSFVGLAHMLYLPLLMVGSAAGPAVISTLMTILLGIAVFSFCTRFFAGQAGSLTLGLLWGTTTIMLVAISPRVDVVLGLYLFLAHYALLRALSSPSRRDHFYVAAVLLGFATAVKYLALLYIFALCPLVLWVAVSGARSVSARLQTLAVFGILFVATVVPWVAKNWIFLREPFYPLFGELVLDPWLVPLYGNFKLPASIDPRTLVYMFDVARPFNLQDAFFSPGRISVEAEGAYYYANPALLLIPLWLLFIRNKILDWLAAPALLYLLILLIPFPRTSVRYLIPAVAPLTLVVVYAAVQLSERFLSTARACTLLVIFAGLALIPSGTAMYARFSRSLALEHFVGASTMTEYLASQLGPGYVPMVRYANEHLGGDSRTLMLFEARGYYFKVPVIQDNSGINWLLLVPKLSSNNCLDGTGITHVLLGIGPLRYYVMRGIDPKRLQWEAFQQFARRCLAPLYQDPTLVLFKIR